MEKVNVEIKSTEAGKTLFSKSNVNCFETIFSEIAACFIQSEFYDIYVPELVLEILKTKTHDQIKELINEFKVLGGRKYHEEWVEWISEKYNVAVDDVIELYRIVRFVELQ